VTNPNLFDQYAADYDRAVQRAIGASGESVAFFADLKARLTRELAPDAPAKILDFGCGIGNTTRSLASHFPNASIVGLDPSAESIRAASARRHPANVSFVSDPTGTIPFADGEFDLAFVACVFHHIERPNRVAAARELRRVLRSNGRALMFEHNPLNPLTRRVVANVPFDEGVELLPKREGEALFSGAGLRVAESGYYFFFPRFLAPLRAAERALRWFPLGAQYFVVGVR
jgi:ubiquinone/menaquinone biosynthesis C-methylase UbiE